MQSSQVHTIVQSLLSYVWGGFWPDMLAYLVLEPVKRHVHPQVMVARKEWEESTF